MGLIEKWNDPFHAEVAFVAPRRWSRELAHLLGGDDALKQYEAMILLLVIVGIASRWRHIHTHTHSRCEKCPF